MLSELMVRVQGGDDDAFRDLYDLTVSAAHLAAFRTTRSVDHSAEVVQEVFLHAWQHAGAYDPAQAPVLGWLLMLTHRRAVDRVRSVTSAAQRDQKEFERSGVADPDLADGVVAGHEARDVRGAVDRLPQKQRDAVTLTYLRGYTMREAATLLDVPVGTVKTRVRDGVTALRGQLRAEAA